MRGLAASVSLTLLFTLVPSAEAVTPRAGAACKKIGAKQISNNREFTCIKKGKKRVWNRGVLIRAQATPTPTPSVTPSPIVTPTPTPTPSPTPTVTPAPTPTVVVTPTPTPTTTPTPTPTPTVRQFTTSDVTSRNSESSCWSIISGKVYDLTGWIRQHPGGRAAILRICGVDGSARFSGQHGGSSSIATELSRYYIGELKRD